MGSEGQASASGRGGRRCGRRVGRRSGGVEHRQRFWAAIARGVTSEDAAVEAGVSPAVGVRWFREAGGMPTARLAALSGRYLSFAEREEIALLRAEGCGVREIARRLRPVAVDDLAGAAAQRRDPRRQAGVPGVDGAVAGRAGGAAPEAGEARRQRAAARLRAGPAGRAWSRVPTATPVPGPDVAWNGPQQAAAARTGGGRRRGARSRSRTGCASTSPMMSRCGSRHEAIYQALYVQGRGALKRELTACLRTGRALRVPRARAAQRAARASSPPR